MGNAKFVLVTLGVGRGHAQFKAVSAELEHLSPGMQFLVNDDRYVMCCKGIVEDLKTGERVYWTDLVPSRTTGYEVMALAYPQAAEPELPKQASEKLIDLVEHLLSYEASNFENDEPIDGAELVEFVSAWRPNAQAALDELLGPLTAKQMYDALLEEAASSEQTQMPKLNRLLSRIRNGAVYE